MKAELDAKLCKEFPILYQQRILNEQQTCMCWGFECGDGWFNLIYNLSNKLEAYNRTVPEGEQIYATQVKEKFGTLRFYTNYVTEEVDSWIQEAEIKSESTCEYCGALSTPKKINGWVSNMCELCRKD